MSLCRVRVGSVNYRNKQLILEMLPIVVSVLCSLPPYKDQNKPLCFFLVFSLGCLFLEVTDILLW